MKDYLITRGVDSKGYGRIYRAVMREMALPIISKAIYAYFCSYAGSGTTAFPKREKITHDLQLNKDTFTKYLKTLLELGYIAKQRTARGNIYTINMNIPENKRQRFESLPGDSEDKLIFTNIKAKGFGTVPKLVMLDNRLSAQAKAIYAYFASFAGAGIVAFPHKNTIIKDLNISERTYYSHFALLTRYAFITVRQRKAQGKFTSSEYLLNEEIPEYDWHSGKSAMSEKLQSERECGSLGNNKNVSVDNLVEKEGFQPMSENFQSEDMLSENLQSEELARSNFGHANIKNNQISNISFNKDQEDKKHEQMEMDRSFTCLTEKQIQKMMGTSRLLNDLAADYELKRFLGHFEDKADADRYLSCYQKVVRELAHQSWLFMQRKGNEVVVDGKSFYWRDLKLRLLQKINYENFSRIGCEIAEKYKTIRSIPKYLRAVIFNLTQESDLPLMV